MLKYNTIPVGIPGDTFVVIYGACGILDKRILKIILKNSCQKVVKKNEKESNGVEVLPNRYQKIIGSHCNRINIVLAQ